ncbi:hypothetical protein BAU15_00460 [Enterococcus sp. JM4C]|uniref:hypothetical protein n=1 Tax=Candidatus Enterococcus huntleyi TaxID=1857217 RepID=UPI00137B18BC|nr:hypothetical protein [Enterococcus sp. JM4C]KAF1299151.1 hypothetical protein BAU15_00460 [Enterococcus sp. JM4C]
MKIENTTLDYWQLDGKRYLKYSSAYRNKLLSIMQNSIFDENIRVYEVGKSLEKTSDYYLFHGEGTLYYTVTRVSSHKTYSSYYSYRSFFPFCYERSANFTGDVRDYLYGVSWDKLSYTEYFYLQMMRYEQMGIYIVGGKKKFGTRWNPRGALEFIVKNEHTNEIYPANALLTQTFRKMVANGLLIHEIKKNELRLLLSKSAKILCQKTKKFYHSTWEKDRLVEGQKDIKPVYEFDEGTINNVWRTPQSQFSSQGLDKYGKTASNEKNVSQTITSIIVDTQTKNNALDKFDILHRVKIYRRKNSLVYQMIKKDIGIIAESEYQVDKIVMEKFFVRLNYGLKLDQWGVPQHSIESNSTIKVRHSDLRIKTIDVSRQNKSVLENLKKQIVSLVDFEILPAIFEE